MKVVRSQRKKVLSSADILRTTGSFRFARKKIRIFRNLWYVRTDKGEGVEQCGHFMDKGVNFSRFCADDFYGQLE